MEGRNLGCCDGIGIGGERDTPGDDADGGPSEVKGGGGEGAASEAMLGRGVGVPGVARARLSTSWSMVAAALALAMIGAAQAMTFDMQYQTKCLFQDIENGQAATIEWRAISKGSMEEHMRERANVFSEEGERRTPCHPECRAALLAWDSSLPPPAFVTPHLHRPLKKKYVLTRAFLPFFLGADADQIPLNVVVTSPVPRSKPLEQFTGQSEGKVYISADHGEHDGDYKICFTAPDAATASDVKLLVDWRVGALAQDWEVLAKKEHIDHISVELKKYEDLVKEMRQEMLHMKKVDKVGYQTREAAHKRVEFFSFLSMVVCISFTVGQYYFLKRFFKGKKML